MRQQSALRKWLPDSVLLLALIGGVILHWWPHWLGVHEHASATGIAAANDTAQTPGYLFPLIFISIMWAALRASEHAESVAHKLREPFGSLVLTFSAVTIEVALVIGVMMNGSVENTDMVARDAMFATLMMILNGLVGVALVAGALRKREQSFNPQSSSAYLGLIATICTVGLILPRFTTAEAGGYMSDQMDAFVAGVSLAVYVAFVFLQSSSHREFFIMDEPVGTKPTAHHGVTESLWGAVGMLVFALVTVVLLSESLGAFLVTFLSKNSLPPTLQGAAIAFLVLLPEGIVAVRSAARSNVQRTINVLHGSALSTIGLTIPAILLVAMLFNKDVELGLQPPEICLLVATLGLSMMHFVQGKTNMLQAIVHLTLFAVWIALLLDPRKYL